MKSFAVCSIAAAAIAPGVFANNNNSTVPGPDPKFLWQTYEMLMVIAPELEDPNTWAFETRKMLLKYGCYCFPGSFESSKPRHGYGGPGLDELDNACRDLYRSQKCIVEDFANNNEECDPEVVYRWFNDNGQVVCGDENDPAYATDPLNSCAMQNCNVEREFAFRVKTITQGSWVSNPDIYDLQDSNYSNFCPATSSSGSGTKTTACCGAGLSRKPFNSVVAQCCNNQVESFGSC